MEKKWLLVISAVLLAMGLMVGCSGGEGDISQDTMLQEPAADDAGKEPAADDAAATDDAANTEADPAAETEATTE